jgi:ribonucleoside-diphosphate reductase alpha chain
MPQGVTAAASPAHALQMRAAESISMGSLALAETTIAYTYEEPLPQADLRAKARLQGYEGDSCGECGNFTLVRNGTCLKCNTCGGTSGCS